MTMLFIMGVLLVFTALGLLASAIAQRRAQLGCGAVLELIEAMTTAPSELTKDLDKSFGERVLIPLQNRFSVGRLSVPTAPSGSAASSTSPATHPGGPSTA